MEPFFVPIVSTDMRLTDEEMIEQVLSGEHSAFNTLVTKYQKKIVGMIFHMTRDFHQSEELGQDVFLEVFRSLSSFDSSRSQFSTWLFRIAQNKTLNALKKMRPVLLPETPEGVCHRNAHNAMVTNEFHAELDRILDRLPTHQKLAFIWAEIEQLSHQEIAQIEGVSIGTIKSRVSRAKQQLQEFIKNKK